jgi:hypothetical protein
MTVSTPLSTPAKSLEARWNGERKAASEAPVATKRPKRPAFDAADLRLLEELSESTWMILQDRYPFRDIAKDDDLHRQLRRKLFILAEHSDLRDLDELQRLVLDALSRAIDY